MVLIARMHIRHDWQKWLLTEQKTVRTLCGKTTTNKLAGIPTISDQSPALINKTTGEKLPGWCQVCVRFLVEEVNYLPAGGLPTTQAIRDQYSALAEEIVKIYGVKPRN